MTNRIEDYALIGDRETAALVGRDGSIDWLCWPRFDSGAVFARLLGKTDNGHWRIAPCCAPQRTSRRYDGDTLILETTFETAEGVVVLIDFMPSRLEGMSHIVRIVRGISGCVPMHADLVMRFDYGSIIPWVSRQADGRLQAIGGPDMVMLHADIELKAEGFAHRGDFTVGAGQSVRFVLGYGSSFAPPPPMIDPEAALERTRTDWAEWAARYRNQGSYRREAMRSLITLKALTYAPTGGIVAAPTTSLPEVAGGVRNWDYRYCWLRDATFTLLALINSGFEAEADDWRRWLRHAVAGNPAQVQIMYGLAGERRLPEWEVGWLEGYGGAKPVRIGNAAAQQLQLDIFGEVMDALYQSDMTQQRPKIGDWDLQQKLVEHLEAIWEQKDEGLWEVRGGRQHFTHSKVMAWVAMDRAIKTVELFGIEAPVARWREVRERIHAQVCREGYDSAKKSFVQAYGGTELDASALMIPLVGFLPPSDPRVASTVEAIGRELMVDGLVCRYRTEKVADGLPGGEGAFLACTFWYADNLVLLGQRERARDLFHHLLSLCNDVGLLAEEYDPKAGRMLGNFPQAFSHVALVNTAHNLSKPTKPAEQRSGNLREGG